MRTLLLNPPQFGTFSEGLQPLGIAMIASVLLKEGHEVVLKDYTAEKYSSEGLKMLLKRYHPEVVGITISTPVADFVYNEVIKTIRKYSSAVIIAGGPHPSVLPQECLEHVDIVVRGEGENTIKELLRNLDGKEKIKGVSYKINDKIIHNPPASFIKDLDSLPFPSRDLLPDIREYAGLPSIPRKKTYNISTSRGCPYNCIFCYQGIFGRIFRTRSAENVLEEWELLVKKYNADVITISDDTFTTDPKRVEEICRGILRRGLKIPWTCSNGIRIGEDTAELLPLMKESGCFHVAFGIESGNEDSLRKIGKGIDLELVRKTVGMARKTGIQKLVGFFIIGFPWEDRQAIIESISFARSLPLDLVHFSLPIPFPGTDLYQEYIKKRDPLPPYKFFYPHSGYVFFEGKGLTKDEVFSLYKKAYRSFYLRGSILTALLRNALSSPGVLKEYFNSILKFIF